MTTDAISSVCSPSVSWMAMPPLQRPLYDAAIESNKMEIELRRMISEYREGEGLSTVFDDQCSYMLSMALSAYETERITGGFTLLLVRSWHHLSNLLELLTNDIKA